MLTLLDEVKGLRETGRYRKCETLFVQKVKRFSFSIFVPLAPEPRKILCGVFFKLPGVLLWFSVFGSKLLLRCGD